MSRRFPRAPFPPAVAHLLLVKPMTPPRQGRFNFLGLLLAVIALVLCGVAIAIRDQNPPPGVARPRWFAEGELKIYLGSLAVAAICGAIWWAYVRAQTRRRMLRPPLE
jgi:hypothetical protein